MSNKSLAISKLSVILPAARPLFYNAELDNKERFFLGPVTLSFAVVWVLQ